MSRSLIDEAVSALARAKAGHDELEKLYNPHVDFAGVEEQAQAIISEMKELM